MPWSHCSRQVPDDAPCPGCGIDKSNWTVFIERTREFRISLPKKANLKLRLWDEEQEDTVAEAAWTLLDVESGETLLEGALDDEGFVTITQKDLGAMVLVTFPGQHVAPLGDAPPEEVGAHRWACKTTELYEFKLAEWLAGVEIEHVDCGLVELEVEETDCGLVELEVEPTDPGRVTVEIT